jgi:hypothetical protein
VQHVALDATILGGWSANRKLSRNGLLGIVAGTATARRPKIGTPRQLFATGLIPDPTINQYAVTADGRKFLVLEPRKGFNETYSVVLNWPAAIK